MSPQNETRLLDLLERIAIALEKGGSGPSGAGQSSGSAPSTAQVPFGKNKGKALGDLGDRQVSFYAFSWTPSTSEQYPKPSPRDLAFKKAAETEAKRRGLVPDTQQEPETAPKAAEQPPLARPTPPPADNIDEDVPF